MIKDKYFKKQEIKQHSYKPAVISYKGFPGDSTGEESTCNPGDIGDAVLSLGQEDPLEKERATHASILAWRIL